MHRWWSRLPAGAAVAGHCWYWHLWMIRQCTKLHCNTEPRTTWCRVHRWSGRQWSCPPADTAGAGHCWTLEIYQCALYTHTHTHTHLTALCPGLPRWAGTRKVKLIWILLKQETVSGSGISWADCKSTPSSRQIGMPAPHRSVFTGRMPFLPPSQHRQSKEGTNVRCT